MNPLSVYPPYSMILEWDPRDNIFVVTIPELANCHSHGHDYAEAVQQGRLAIEVSIDLNRELALPLPEPVTFEHQSDRWWNRGEGTFVAGDRDGEYPPYSMVLEWDPRDDIFVTTIPEFRGARTHGGTYDLAARMGREVIEMFVDVAREDGEPLPVVRTFRPRFVGAIA